MQNFPQVTRDDWLKRAPNAGDALQGRMEGPRALRATHSPWQVFARIDSADLGNALRQAVDDLAHGAYDPYNTQ